MSNLKYCVGIDVSKKDFHCCLSVIDTEQSVKVKSTHRFPNSATGFKLFADWIKRGLKEELPVFCLMEATGVYHEQLAWFLYDRELPVSILLPNKAKKYLQANGAKSKNDKIDARGLAQIGAEKRLELWVPPSRHLYDLRCCTRQHQAINEMHTAISNQLEAIRHAQFQNREIVRQLEKTLALLEKQIGEMEDAIAKTVKSDAVLNAHYRNISVIKGIGLLSFAVVTAEMNGFALFKDAASVASYAGYDVVENQSGNHVGRTKISKKGNPRIRRILHMPALCAVRDDQPQFRDLFERVYKRTGIKMKGYVAVQKKLLAMVYHLWKKEEAYDPRFNYGEKIIAPENSGATHDKIPQGSFH